MPNTDQNVGTENQPVEAQSAGTPQVPDEVTTLRSRNAGLDAKVTTLSQALKAAERARLEAELQRERQAREEAERLMLHACEIEFDEPLTGRALRIECQVPF